MFEAIKQQLEAGGISNEVAEVIDAEVKKALKNVNDENATLRNKNKDLSSSFEEVSTSKGQLEEQMKSLDERIAQAKEDGKGELVKELNAEREAKDVLQKSLEGLQKANTGLKLDRAVSETLKTFDIRDDHRDTTEFMLRSRVTVNDSGDMIYKDNGVEASIEDGFKGYFGANQGKLNPQGNGGGSGANDGGGSGNTKTKSRDEFEKMNPAQKATFMNDGGKLIA